MIIFKKPTNNNDITFCILNNPKCGSSTISGYIFPQIRKKYEVLFSGGGPKPDPKSGYNNHNYHHCNMEGAVKFLLNRDIDIDKSIFITTIRNPLARLLSTYFFDLKAGGYYNIMKTLHGVKKALALQEKEKKRIRFKNLDRFYHEDRIVDIEKFLLYNEHMRHFLPNNFRVYKDYKTTDVARLEFLKQDFEDIIHKYSLNISTTKLDKKINKNNDKEDIILPDTLKKKVYDAYLLDYIDGGYSRY